MTAPPPADSPPPSSSPPRSSSPPPAGLLPQPSTSPKPGLLPSSSASGSRPPSGRRRRRGVPVLVAAATLLPIGAIAAGMPAAAAPPTTAQPAATHTVAWGSVRITVPANWPVHDLDRDPTRCVRMDVHALYLGTPGPTPACPSRILGKVEAVHLEPASTAARDRAGLAGVPAKVAGVDATESRLAETSRDVVVHLPSLGVVATASFGVDDREARRILATITPSGAPAVPAPAVPAAPRAAAPTGAPNAAGGADTVQSRGPAPGVHTGYGFDACTAPSTTAMTAWLSSPYRGLGVYIGGANRSCSDGHLSASWIRTVTAQGWHLIPIYVGYQAPCVQQGGLAEFSTVTSTAAVQGSSAARDAVARAQSFGLPSGSPIYFDMEAYTADSTCRDAVYAFLNNWTAELHVLGYQSAVYGSSSSVIGDLAAAVGRRGYHLPDAVWLARWNGIASVFGDPYLPDEYWSRHQRLHQYRGGHDETWGGVRINIDNNYNDGPAVSAGSPLDYGHGVYGPGSSAYSTVGSWRSGAPHGLRSTMEWTYSSGTTATASASWAPRVAPGRYDVAAYIPSNHAGGHGRYTITGATTTTVVLNQGAYSNAYASLGRFNTDADGRLTVRLENNADAAGAHTVGADAMRFSYLAPLVAGAAWRPVTDFTGDRRPERAVWRPENGRWYRPGAPSIRYGLRGDVPVAGDYTGQRRSEVAVYRPSNGRWYRRGVPSVRYGSPGDIPVPADYTDDGRTDIAVWRNSTGTWHRPNIATVRWGVPGDIPVAADYTGDGAADYAIWRPSTGTYWLRGIATTRWGTAGDVPVPADFTGDGRADLAVWRPSNGVWYLPDGSRVAWGTAGDVPVPGDFTGDGRADLAVWRPSNGVWYVREQEPVRYGTRGDVPT